MSCWGQQHLWASLVKFNDCSAWHHRADEQGALKALCVLAGLLWKWGQRRAGKEEQSAHGMAGGGVRVAESYWVWTELGTCRQRSWCGWRSWYRQIAMMLHCNLRSGSRVWRSRCQDHSDPGVNCSSLGSCIPFNLLFHFFGNL